MPAAPIADAPSHTLAPFRGPTTTVQQMVDHVAGARGERSVLVRNVAEHAIRNVQPKDYLSEILAIRNFVAEKCWFTNDALTTEWVKDPQRICEEIVKYGKARIDCDDYASVLAAMFRAIGREVEFVVVGFGGPGSYSHVLCRVKEPKSGRWIVADPVAGTKEGEMLRRVTTHKIWRVGAAPAPTAGAMGEFDPAAMTATDFRAREPHPERYPACATTTQTASARQQCSASQQIRGLDGADPFVGANPCWVAKLPACPRKRIRRREPAAARAAALAPPLPPMPEYPAPAIEDDGAGAASTVGGLLLFAALLGAGVYWIDRRGKKK